MRKILSTILICSMLWMSIGCSLITSKTTIQTTDGDILSQPLSKTIGLLTDIKNIYIIIAGITTTAYKDELISADSYNEIANFANVFENEFNKVALDVIRWYDFEDSIGNFDERQSIILAIKNLNLKLNDFANLLEMAGVKKEDIQIIKTTIRLLNTIGAIK